ncbi:hypothetical protein KC334_g3250 [Hortaea werneckii]|nr:hypothetical protein KC334_g3250 [Hortaea werneckii]KAI7022074.1 hypothetical protein KC355_g2186 [Hortaea werneckii]
MESHAADQAKAAVVDLMSMAKWKAPHASAVAWQAGLDEIDRFYRSAIGQSATVPKPTAKYDGSSNEYNPQQAGPHDPQSMLGPAHGNRLSFSPVDFELTVKQNGAPVLQQEKAAESLLQPNSSVPKPGSKLHPPHASSSLDLENKTPLPEIKQDSLFTEVKPSAEPSPTQHQAPSDTVESDLLKPPTQRAKKTPPAQSQSSLPRLKSVQQDSSTPLQSRTHEWPPLQQNPQWNSVGEITVRPRWTLEPPPPPGLQPAFEEKGKAPDVGKFGEGSQVAIPLREKLEKGGSSRSGGASVSGDEVVEGDKRREDWFSVEDEGREVDSADEQRRLDDFRANVMERDQGADVTVYQKEKSSDGMRSDREDDAEGSNPDGDASSTITHTSAPDMVVANEQHKHKESNEQTNAPKRNSNKTTPLNPQDQTVPATDPHTNPNPLTTNPPRWSPTNSRTFSNARDEIASLKRGRENSFSPRSSSSNAAHLASSPLPPAKRKKKTRNEQTASSSNAGEETSEQSPPEEPKLEDGNPDSVNAPTPADQESPGDTAESDPPVPDLLSTQPTPSSPAKEKKNQTHETKKRKRSPRRAMSKRELSNLEGTTVEGKLRRRGVQEREGQSQLQSQIQMQEVQKQQQQQVQKERNGQREGQEEEGKEKGKVKGERNEGRQGKGKGGPATGDGVSRRKRQRRL